MVDRIDVAALTKPEDDFARKDQKTMTAEERELLMCTNYVVTITHEIEEALPGTAGARRAPRGRFGRQSSG